MEKFVCTECGYVYDPEVGDFSSDIDEGTAFDDLPEDWSCPECGCDMDDFIPED